MYCTYCTKQELYEDKLYSPKLFLERYVFSRIILMCVSRKLVCFLGGISTLQTLQPRDTRKTKLKCDLNGCAMSSPYLILDITAHHRSLSHIICDIETPSWFDSSAHNLLWFIVDSHICITHNSQVCNKSCNSSLLWATVN